MEVCLGYSCQEIYALVLLSHPEMEFWTAVYVSKYK